MPQQTSRELLTGGLFWPAKRNEAEFDNNTLPFTTNDVYSDPLSCLPANQLPGGQ